MNMKINVEHGYQKMKRVRSTKYAGASSPPPCDPGGASVALVSVVDQLAFGASRAEEAKAASYTGQCILRCMTGERFFFLKKLRIRTPMWDRCCCGKNEGNVGSWVGLRLHISLFLFRLFFFYPVCLFSPEINFKTSVSSPSLVIRSSLSAEAQLFGRGFWAVHACRETEE